MTLDLPLNTRQNALKLRTSCSSLQNARHPPSREVAAQRADDALAVRYAIEAAGDDPQAVREAAARMEDAQALADVAAQRATEVLRGRLRTPRECSGYRNGLRR